MGWVGGWWVGKVAVGLAVGGYGLLIFLGREGQVLGSLVFLQL